MSSTSMESSDVTPIQLLSLIIASMTLALSVFRYIQISGLYHQNTTSPPPPPPPHEAHQDISERLNDISNLLPSLRWTADQDSEGADPSPPDLMEVRQQVSLVQLQVVACQLWLSSLKLEGGDCSAEEGKIREEVTKLGVRAKIAAEAGLRYLNGSVDSNNSGIAKM